MHCTCYILAHLLLHMPAAIEAAATLSLFCTPEYYMYVAAYMYSACTCIMYHSLLSMSTTIMCEATAYEVCR